MWSIATTDRYYNYLHYTTKVDMDVEFAENHKFIQGVGRINVVQSVKKVCKVKCDVNCIYIIYLL